MLDESPTMAAVPRFAYILGHPVALVEIHSHAVVQNHGYYSSMGATAGRSATTVLVLKKTKGLF